MINAAVARTSQPELSLASYSVARSLFMFLQSPMLMIRQTTASLVQNKKSFGSVCKFIFAPTGFITLLMIIISFTPAGYWIFTSILGATHDIAVYAQLSMGVLCILPITACIRNIYQGIAVLTRQTNFVPVGTSIRLAMTGLFSFSLALYTDIPGPLVGTLAYAGSHITEDLFMFLTMRKSVKYVKKYATNEHTKPLDFKAIGYFFAPLALTGLLRSMLNPVINVGLARSFAPEIALAAFSVGIGIVRLLDGPAGAIHLCSLNYTNPDDPDSYVIIRRFSVGVGLISSLIFGIISFSPIGMWVLTILMGVTVSVAEPALGVMRVLVLFPLLKCWYEYVWGILMRRRSTGWVGIAKVVSLASVVIIGLAGLFFSSIHPAVVGALAYLSGAVTEMALIHFLELKEASASQKELGV